MPGPGVTARTSAAMKNAMDGSIRSALAALEHQAEVVGRHLHTLREDEPGAGSNVRHGLHVANAPLGVARTKIKIELLVARGSMVTETPVRPVQEHNAPCSKQSLRAFEQCRRRG